MRPFLLGGEMRLIRGYGGGLHKISAGRLLETRIKAEGILHVAMVSQLCMLGFSSCAFGPPFALRIIIRYCFFLSLQQNRR